MPTTQAERQEIVRRVIGPRERQAERRRELDVRHEREGRAVSQGRELEVRARALRLSRSALVLTDAQRRFSIERERAFLEAAVAYYRGVPISLTTFTELRHGSVDVLGAPTITASASGPKSRTLRGAFAV